jgi:hypothetical protein
MTAPEIVRLIHKYIGVFDGYLGDFSYRTHEEFYPLYCNLDINPSLIKASTRARFQEILRRSSPEVQAKIVRGILAKYPPGPDHPQRTEGLHDEFVQIAQRLEGVAGVPTPTPETTSEAVELALANVETLIKSTGAPTGVDRIHTAIHAYLQAVCDEQSISHPENATILGLFKLVLEQHPAFAKAGARSDDITKICRSMFTVLDVLNPIRNNASLAHPNGLLDPPEAMLVINATRTILHFINAKLVG